MYKMLDRIEYKCVQGVIKGVCSLAGFMTLYMFKHIYCSEYTLAKYDGIFTLMLIAINFGIVWATKDIKTVD